MSGANDPAARDPRRDPRRRGEIAALVAILLLAGALRTLYLLEVRATPAFAAPGVDAGFHHFWARGLATGEWLPPEGQPDPDIPGRAYFRPPGYPYFLAAVYALSGGSWIAPRVAQMLLGLVNALLAFFLARRAYGRGAGLISAALAGIYWVFIYFEGELHAPALFVCLSLAATNLLAAWRERTSPVAAAAAGLAFGAAALVRPNALLMLLAAAAWMVWTQRRRGGTRRALLGAATLVGAAALALLPATVRNLRVSGELVPISTNAGINLFLGNNEAADGLVATEIEGLGSFRTCFDWPAIVAAVRARVGRDLGDAEVSAWFAAEARRFIREHPGRFAALTWKRARLFWGPLEVAHNTEVHWERRHSAVLGRIPGSFAALLGLALVGLGLLALERRGKLTGSGGPDPRAAGPTTALVLALALAYFASVVPFFAAARYRLPVVPFLIVLAGAGADRLWRLVRARRWGIALGGLAAFALLWGLASRPAAGYAPSEARWYFDRGTDHERTGRPDLAAAQYERALALEPAFFEAHYNLGHKLRDVGRTDEAIAHWEAAAALQPGFAPAHFNLALARRELGRAGPALESMERAVLAGPRSIRYRMALGDMLVAAGRMDEALEQYRAALALDADHVAAARNAAWILAVHPDPARRDPVQAVQLAESANARTDGRSPSVLDALAAAYAAAGRLGDAARAARAAAAAARAQGNEALARAIEERLGSYERAQDPAGPRSR